RGAGKVGEGRGGIVGVGQSSIALIKSRKWRSFLRWPEVILPNSLMSAPAIKVRPPPINTPPLIESSFLICSTADAMPSGTPGLSALTGGLLTVMTPISPSRVKDTSSLINYPPQKTSHVVTNLFVTA